MDPSSILEAKDISFRFEEDGPKILDSVSLTLRKGEATMLMGPSGSGKSTLAYVLAGLYPEYAGILKGEVICPLGKLSKLPPERRARAVSLVFQNPDDQFAMDTAGNEILFALENINFQGDMVQRATELLTKCGLSSFFNRPVHTLSGGEKQKLSLATALATDAELLILDEPFANVDPESASMLLDIFKSLKDQGISFLIIDHRIDFWLGMLDSVIFIDKNGRLERDRIPSDKIRESEDKFKELGLFPPGSPQWPERKISSQNKEMALAAKNLSVFLGKIPLLTNIDLSLPKGSLTAIIGRNGVGKTSLLLALCGLMKTKGSLRLLGSSGLVFQNPSFQFLTQSVLEEVILSLAPKTKLKGKYDPVLREEAERLLFEFSLSQHEGKSPWQLSQGEQRRLAVLTMLALDRALLFLDEPTYAQDEESTIQIMELLSSRVERGLTALFVTHDLSLAKAYASRVLILEKDGLKELEPAERWASG